MFFSSFISLICVNYGAAHAVSQGVNPRVLDWQAIAIVAYSYDGRLPVKGFAADHAALLELAEEALYRGAAAPPPPGEELLGGYELPCAQRENV